MGRARDGSDVWSGKVNGKMGLEEAIGHWRRIVGDGHVITASGSLDRLSRSTQEHGTRPAAVIRPGSTAEVSQAVRVARRHAVSLYPISGGKNWGYGDACAVTDGQVILDLGRLDRIVEVNVPLGYAVVEAGVTQGQLSRYLRENNLPLWLDVTGAGPDASIVGNTIERGFGHTPCGDHFHASAGYEVVLADGQILQTGFGHYANAKAAAVFKPGLGPTLDGLFTQSNLGIVTRMGVWLVPKPQCLAGFAFSVPDDADLERVIEVLRPLRLAGILPSAIHVANDLRVISARRRYPWDQAGGRTPLPAELRREMRRAANLGAWNVLGGLYGTKRSVAAAKHELQRALGGIAKLRVFDEGRIRLAESVHRLLGRVGLGQGLGELIAAIRPAFALLQGEPSPEHLAGAGWRSRQTPLAGNPDPLDNQCGLYWLSPVVPMTGSAARDVLRVMEPLFERHGFEPLVTMTSITPRALCCVTTVAFDKQNPAEARRASECYDALFDAVMRAGYVPYRVGIQSMGKLARNSTVYWDVVARIKAALDPAALLAPGRYFPPTAADASDWPPAEVSAPETVASSK